MTSFTGRNVLTICAVVVVFVIAGIISCTSEASAPERPAKDEQVCLTYQLWTWAAQDRINGMEKFCTEGSL